MDNSIRTLNGCIFNIQRYSLHDGPGIRTIVFLKGCPLRCPWCANPESQNASPEMMGSEMVGKVVTVDDVIRVVEKDSVFYKRSGGGMTLSGGEPLMQPEFSTALMTVAKEHGFNTAIETSGF
ncbi:MAG: 4Fe-4S cluster-binding domain-containing protein, partial [Aminobacterium sp.]